MSIRMTTVLSIAALTASPALAGDDHGHGSDFIIGINDTGQLAFEFDGDDLEPISDFIMNGGLNGDFTGYFFDEPGFASLDEDEPDEGFFMLGAGADIYVMINAIDAPFQVYDPDFDAVVPAGGMFALGSPDFDTHPFWTVDTTSPAFDANVFEYDVTLKFVDLGSTGYADSEAITVTFSRVPAPGTAGLLAISGLGAIRRRR